MVSAEKYRVQNAEPIFARLRARWRVFVGFGRLRASSGLCLCTLRAPFVSTDPHATLCEHQPRAPPAANCWCTAERRSRPTCPQAAPRPVQDRVRLRALSPIGGPQVLPPMILTMILTWRQHETYLCSNRASFCPKKSRNKTCRQPRYESAPARAAGGADTSQAWYHCVDR